jgi:hypothetical protein
MDSAAAHLEGALPDFQRDILARKRRQRRREATRPVLSPGWEEALHADAKSAEGSGAEQRPAVY